MKHKHALIAVLAVVAFVCGGLYVANAAANGEAVCHRQPVTSNAEGGTMTKIVVTCKVPRIPGPTVTATTTETAVETVTATATETVTATVTTEPTSEPTSEPTPTEEPTEEPAGFPDATNTGPTGTLTPYTGPSTINTAGTVIENQTLGCITVNAPAVIIRNSHISCRPGYAAVTIDDRTLYGKTPLLLEDVEIDCQNGPGHAIGEAHVTVRRADIHGCENGIDANQNITVEDSYIHDLYEGGGSHTDGIQLASGHWNGTGWDNAAFNITIRHNTIYGVGADGRLGTSAIISNPAGDTNVLIENNLLAGGAYTLYCPRPGVGTNYRVLANHFTRAFSAKYGAFGPSDDCGDETHAGNVDHDTGAPLTLN